MLDLGILSVALMGMALLLLGFGLAALLLLPVRPMRLFAGLVILHAGLLLLLVELAGLCGGAQGCGGGKADAVAASVSLVASLHGLGVAVILIGLMFGAVLAAVLIALQHRVGSLQPDVLEELAQSEWLSALGDTAPMAPKWTGARGKGK